MTLADPPPSDKYHFFLTLPWFCFNFIFLYFFELIRPNFGLESNGFRYDRSMIIIVLIKYFFQQYKNKSNNFEWWKVSHCCDIQTRFLLQWYSWNRKYLLLQRRKQSNDILKNLCYRLVMRLWHEVLFLKNYLWGINLTHPLNPIPLRFRAKPFFKKWETAGEYG